LATGVLVRGYISKRTLESSRSRCSLCFILWGLGGVRRVRRGGPTRRRGYVGRRGDITTLDRRRGSRRAAQRPGISTPQALAPSGGAGGPGRHRRLGDPRAATCRADEEQSARPAACAVWAVRTGMMDVLSPPPPPAGQSGRTGRRRRRAGAGREGRSEGARSGREMTGWVVLTVGEARGLWIVPARHCKMARGGSIRHGT
jgi:hypothetical protein